MTDFPEAVLRLGGTNTGLSWPDLAGRVEAIVEVVKPYSGIQTGLIIKFTQFIETEGYLD